MFSHSRSTPDGVFRGSAPTRLLGSLALDCFPRSQVSRGSAWPPSARLRTARDFPRTQPRISTPVGRLTFLLALARWSRWLVGLSQDDPAAGQTSRTPPRGARLGQRLTVQPTRVRYFGCNGQHASGLSGRRVSGVARCTNRMVHLFDPLRAGSAATIGVPKARGRCRVRHRCTGLGPARTGSKPSACMGTGRGP